jgi:hypothetical protein
MNRGIGHGPQPAAGESRRGRLLSCPASANRYRWWAAEVAAFTADLRRQGRSGNLARSAERARSQPDGAEWR